MYLQLCNKGYKAVTDKHEHTRGLIERVFRAQTWAWTDGRTCEEYLADIMRTYYGTRRPNPQEFDEKQREVIHRIWIELLKQADSHGVTPEDTPPKYIVDARRTANERQLDEITLLREDALKMLREATYPSAECLRPYELELVGRGETLAGERRAHVDGCVPCGRLSDREQAQVRLSLGQALGQDGQIPEAIGELQKARELSKDDPMILVALGHGYAVAGEVDKARAILETLNTREDASSLALGLIHAALGEKDEAFSFFDRAYAEYDGSLLFLNVDPIFDGLRSDPRFDSLVKRMGLPGPQATS